MDTYAQLKSIDNLTMGCNINYRDDLMVYLYHNSISVNWSRNMAYIRFSDSDAWPQNV